MIVSVGARLDAGVLVAVDLSIDASVGRMVLFVVTDEMGVFCTGGITGFLESQISVRTISGSASPRNK